MSHATARTARRRAVATAVGANVRRARQASGRTVDELADAAGVARSTWYHVERGTRSGDAVTRERIAAALDSDVATLFAPPPVENEHAGAAA